MWPDGDGQLVIYLWYSTSLCGLCLQYVSCRYCTCICSMWIYHPQHGFASLHLESWALPRLRWLNQRRPRWSFAQTSQMHKCTTYCSQNQIPMTVYSVKCTYIYIYTHTDRLYRYEFVWPVCVLCIWFILTSLAGWGNSAAPRRHSTGGLSTEKHWFRQLKIWERLGVSGSCEEAEKKKKKKKKVLAQLIPV